MIHRLLVWAALVCSALLIASFVMFVHDQAAAGSQHQQSELAGTATVAAPATTHHGQPRRFVDSAAHALSAPFRSLVDSTNPWVMNGVPTVLGLLVYGVGLSYLARYSRGYS